MSIVMGCHSSLCEACWFTFLDCWTIFGNPSIHPMTSEVWLCCREMLSWLEWKAVLASNAYVYLSVTFKRNSSSRSGQRDSILCVDDGVDVLPREMHFFYRTLSHAWHSKPHSILFFFFFEGCNSFDESFSWMLETICHWILYISVGYVLALFLHFFHLVFSKFKLNSITQVIWGGFKMINKRNFYMQPHKIYHLWYKKIYSILHVVRVRILVWCMVVRNYVMKASNDLMV